jgi:hypothetical protein
MQHELNAGRSVDVTLAHGVLPDMPDAGEGALPQESRHYPTIALVPLQQLPVASRGAKADLAAGI